jgi:hypothetical protein
MPLVSSNDAVLVVFGGDAALRDKLAGSLGAFSGDGVVTGVRAADGDPVKALARRFIIAAKRGPLVVPAARVVVTDLVSKSDIVITPTPVLQYATPIDVK